MKKFIAISAILAGAGMQMSCAGTCCPDAFSAFLHNERLRVSEFQAKTNATGYEAAIKVVGVSDTNLVFNGWILLENPGRQQACSARRAAERRLLKGRLSTRCGSD